MCLAAMASGWALHRQRYLGILPWMVFLFVVLHGVGFALCTDDTGLGLVVGMMPLSREIQSNARLSALIASSIGLLCLLVGGSVSKRQAPIGSGAKYEFAGYRIKWFLLAGAAVISAFFLTAGGRMRLSYGIMLVFSSFGNADDYYAVRNAISDAGWPQWFSLLYALIVDTALPLAALACLYAALTTQDPPRRRAYSAMWLSGSALSIFSAILGLNKYPFIQIVLSQLVLWVILRTSEGRVSAGTVFKSAVMGVMLVSVLMVLYSATHGTGSLDELWSELEERSVKIPTDSTLAHFYAVPDVIPFQNWSGSRTMHALLAPWTEKYTSDLSTCQMVSGVVTGHAYNMNCGLVGDGWAQLGFLGVAQGATIIFGLMTWIDLREKRYGRGGWRIPLLAFMIGAAPNIYSGELMVALLGSGALSGPIIYRLLFTKLHVADAQAAKGPAQEAGTGSTLRGRRLAGLSGAGRGQT
ncbi:MAG: hypothetical protein ABSH34_02230 [Verrucomicrobiota bacterium]|jgi:hypothetical protein